LSAPSNNQCLTVFGSISSPFQKPEQCPLWLTILFLVAIILVLRLLLLVAIILVLWLLVLGSLLRINVLASLLVALR
jgi:hypothetical protein